MSFTAPVGSRQTSAEVPVSVQFSICETAPQRLINYGASLQSSIGHVIPSPMVGRRISTPLSPRTPRSCLYGQLSGPSASVPSPLHIGRQLRQPPQNSISLASCPQAIEGMASQGWPIQRSTQSASASGQVMLPSNDSAERTCGYPVAAMTSHASPSSPLPRSLPRRTVQRQVTDPIGGIARMHGSIEAPCQRESVQLSQTPRSALYPRISSPLRPGPGRTMSPRREVIPPRICQIGSGVVSSLQSKPPSPVRVRLENSPRESFLQHSTRNFNHPSSQGNIPSHQFMSHDKRLIGGSITTKSSTIGSGKTDTVPGRSPSRGGCRIELSPTSPVLRSPRQNYNSTVVSPRLVSASPSQNMHVGGREVESIAIQSDSIVEEREECLETESIAIQSDGIAGEREDCLETDLENTISEAKIVVSQDREIRSCSNYDYSSDSDATLCRGQREYTVAEAPTLKSNDVGNEEHPSFDGHLLHEDYSLPEEGTEFSLGAHDTNDDIDMDSCPSYDLPELNVEHLQVGDNILACFEADTWLEAEISLIMADGTILVNWRDGCPNNRIKTISEIRYKPVTLFHLGVAPRPESRLTRPNFFSTKLRTEGDSQVWVRKRMPQVVERQSFQYMFRIVFLMSECPFFSDFMEAFLAACDAEPHDERSRVLVSCDDGEVASLALQQLCPVTAMSELQRKATKNIPLKDHVPEATWVRPASMRARTFSISGTGLPELSDKASAESTMLAYMVRTSCEESLVQTHFETIRLLEDMYASRVVSDFVPRRMLLVFQDPSYDSNLDVVELLQKKGLTELETMQVPLPLNNEDMLRDLARYIAETMVAQSPESPTARDSPIRDVSSRGRLGSALGGASLVI